MAAMINTEPRCDTCRWWLPLGLGQGSEWGECRGSTPLTVSENGVGAWPVTAAAKWCAKWTAKPKPKAEKPPAGDLVR